jgi:hypothetical protein
MIVDCWFCAGRNFDDEYKLFCVPKPGASEQELIANIEYACSQLGNCTTISTNGDCFLPNTTLNHGLQKLDVMCTDGSSHPHHLPAL